MSKKIHAISLFLLFLTGVVFVVVFRLWQVKQWSQVPFSPQPSDFHLNPPMEALEGKLVTIRGDVQKEPRDTGEFETVEEAGGVLIEGEKIATGRQSRATIEFPDFSGIDVGSDTEISLSNLMPDNFLLHQISGTVSYRLLGNGNTFSVRSLHALMSFEPGESEVAVYGDELVVRVVSGKATLALVDLENETHVWEIEEGQEALINDTERRVEIK